MVTKTQQPPADWSLRPRGVTSAAGQGALALAVLSGVSYNMLHLHPGWAAAGTAVGLACTVATGVQLPAKGLAYRIGCWMSAGGWMGWVLVNGWWDVNTLAALGIGALGTGLLAPWANAPQRPRGQTGETSTAMVVRRHAPLAEEWSARIKRVAKVSVQIDDVREWPTRTGFDMLLAQPSGPSSRSQLENAASGLAEDARLDHGCGVEFVDGPKRGTLWMKVSTVNRLKDDIDHPGDYSPRSALDGISLGEHRDGNPMHIEVRQPRTIVVGTTGSAKTGLLHTITAELGRCVDHLTWHMDLNGGGVSQAWLRPWLDGEVTRAAIDWAAPCPEEALLMSYAHVCIAKERKTAYSKRRMDADSQLLPIGKDVPQVTTVLDEGFEVLSPTIRDPLQRTIRDNIEEVARIGRNEACQILASALRSTSNTLSTDLLALFHNKIILAGGAQKEIDYFYDYAQGPKVADLSGPGTGFVKRFGSPDIRAWKAFYMKPKRDIYPASLSISRIRPDLDGPSVLAAGEAYRTRHDRMRWMFSTPEERAHLTPPAPIELPGVTDDRGQPVVWNLTQTHPASSGVAGRAVATMATASSPATRPASHLSLLQGGTTTGWGTPEQVADRSRGGQPRPVLAAEQPGTPGRLHAEQVHEIEARPVPELLTRALAVFGADTRVHSVVLAEALNLDQLELADLLRSLGVRTLKRAFERGGNELRGYAREDLETAAGAIRRGELQVPAEVTDWPAA